MALFRSSWISLAWRRASCAAQGLCTPYCRLGCSSEAGLESELELDSIESQDLFLELVMDSGFHFLHKGSYINA